jgi:hypothetical protein
LKLVPKVPGQRSIGVVDPLRNASLKLCFLSKIDFNLKEAELPTSVTKQSFLTSEMR